MAATGTEFIDRNGIYYRTEICMKGVVEEGECILVSALCDKIVIYRSATDFIPTGIGTIDFDVPIDLLMIYLKYVMILEKIGKK